MNHIETMKLALDALEAHVINFDYEQFTSICELEPAKDAIIALREAIEQSEKPKPVACQHKRYTVDEHEQTGTCYDCDAQGRMRFVVYETTPPKREWQGLTDAEILEVIRPLCGDPEAARMLAESSTNEYRAIEAKLKEKNT